MIDLSLAGLAILVVVMISVCSTVFVVRSRDNDQFKVIYSLDRRENDMEIIKLINNADKYVLFAVYYFTKTEIADALIRAKERGVIVRGITDRAASEDSNKSVVDRLRRAGISIETQKHEDGIMHMKLLVTDKAYASGSYNWTGSATLANDEVLEIGTNSYVHDEYLKIIKKVIAKNQ